MKHRPAWAPVVVAAGLIAGSALLAALAWPGADATTPPTAAPAPVQALALPAPPADTGPLAVPATAHAPAAATPPNTAVVDLCGLGRLPAPAPGGATDEPPDLNALPAPVGREPLAAARTALLAQLRQGEPRARAIALLLSPPPADDPAAEKAWSRELLSQAQASAQPDALTWAEPACAAQPDPAACRIDLIRTRLRLEPDNAAHWAALADEDPTAADEAWRGLLQARRWQERPQALLLATQAALPATLPGYLRLALGAETDLRASPQPASGEGFMLDRCRQPVPGRAEECGALAQLLAEHSDALRTLASAVTLGQAAGWPAERQQRLRAEHQQLAHAAPAWQGEAGRPLACGTVQAWQRHLADVARIGEVSAVRAGLSVTRARHPEDE